MRAARQAGWHGLGGGSYIYGMSGLRCLLYMSHATREMAPGEIDRLLERARTRNRVNGVTGALLHYGGHFMQVLEGEASAVEQCFERIRTDPRHAQITPLFSGDIDAPRFPDWSMRYVSSGSQPDRAVAAFLDQIEKKPCAESVRQAIALLHRLAAGNAAWQSR